MSFVIKKWAAQYKSNASLMPDNNQFVRVGVRVGAISFLLMRFNEKKIVSCACMINSS